MTFTSTAVVVPLYKFDLNEFERISLDRALAVFSERAIILLIPDHLRGCTLDGFGEWPPNVRLVFVDDRRMSSVSAYNQWLLSDEFYCQFAAWSHILIYQLDAYAFRDDLDRWASSDLDYIGARIHLVPGDSSRIVCTGAGGFSLRRIESFRRAIRENRRIFFRRDLLESLAPYNLNGAAPRVGRYLLARATGRLQVAAANNALEKLRFRINEDVVFGKYVPRYYSWFRVADAQQALHFCIDGSVDDELHELGNGLPFGAHAWWTRPDNLSAWSRYIPLDARVSVLAE